MSRQSGTNMTVSIPGVCASPGSLDLFHWWHLGRWTEELLYFLTGWYNASPFKHPSCVFCFRNIRYTQLDAIDASIMMWPACSAVFRWMPVQMYTRSSERWYKSITHYKLLMVAQTYAQDESWTQSVIIRYPLKCSPLQLISLFTSRFTSEPEK